MLELMVQICRQVDDAQPGWGECKLTDALGDEHLFVEKIPVVTQAPLASPSSYPQPGVIACTIIKRHDDTDGNTIVEVDTLTPWGVTSMSGRHRFKVLPAQLRDPNPTSDG